MPIQVYLEKLHQARQYLISKLQQISQLPKVQKFKNILISANLLHHSTGISPLKFYLLAFSFGLILLSFSMTVGLASFWVVVEIETTGGEKLSRTLDLGYLSQANYGLWYLIFCPVLLAIVACAYDSMRRTQESHPSIVPSLEQIGKAWWIALLGIIVLGFFVSKNVIVEWNDYKNLGLGWVQAKSLQDYRSEIEKTNAPIDLVAKGKTFDRFLIPKDESFIQREEIRSIFLTKVDPQLEVQSFWGMIFFIVLTKFWVGLWEAIVIYFAILTFVWGIKAAQNLDLQALKDETGAFYHLSWLRRPAFYIFLVGILVNVFCILRYVSNAVKGSYGKWDQYWSLLVFSPVLFLIPLSLILSKVNNSTDNEAQVYFSKRVITVIGVWIISFGYVFYLLLGYINPRHQTIIVACFKPFIEIFKKLFGF